MLSLSSPDRSVSMARGDTEDKGVVAIAAALGESRRLGGFSSVRGACIALEREGELARCPS